VTTEELKSYVDHRIIELKELFTRQHTDFKELWRQEYTTNKEAVDKASQSIDRRLEAMNEFRKTINDVQSQSATKEQLETIKDRVTDIRIQVAAWAVLASIVTAIITSLVVSEILKSVK